MKENESWWIAWIILGHCRQHACFSITFVLFKRRREREKEWGRKGVRKQKREKVRERDKIERKGKNRVM